MLHQPSAQLGKAVEINPAHVRTLEAMGKMKEAKAAYER